jgi:hypothetical protein
MPVGGAMHITDEDMRQASLDHPELQAVHKVIKEAKLTVEVPLSSSSFFLSSPFLVLLSFFFSFSLF